MKKLIAFALAHHRFVTILTLFCACAGLWAVFHMHREVWPDVDLETMIVEAEYPGASPEQIETLIIQPIEHELRTINDIKRVTALAVEGFARITVAIEPYARDTDRVMNDVQRAVDRAEDLPADLPKRPRIREVNTRRDPVMTMAVSGLPEPELQTVVRHLETRLMNVPGLAKIERTGWRDAEIWVEIEPEKLRRFQVRLEDIGAALQHHNVNIPGGPLIRCRAEETSCGPGVGDREVLIRTSGEFTGPEDVAGVVVRSNEMGQGVRVGDVARVSWQLAAPVTLLRSEGARGILLSFIKRPGTDAVALARAVRATAAEFQLQALPALRIAFPDDYSYYVERRLRVLLWNGAIGLALVLAILLIFLSPQSAIGAAVGIPVALSTALAVLYLSGGTLNLITLFALILCLGMLVDEDIVVAENIHRYLGAPGDPRANIIAATGELSRSIVITALTTIAAFVPLLFVQGIIGKFIWWIPWVVIIVLTASVTEALVLLPTHLYHLALRAKTVQAPRTFEWFERVRHRYQRCLSWALDHRGVALVGLLTLAGAGVGAARYASTFVLFPPSGVEQFFVRAEAPIGTPLETMERLIAPIEAAVAALPQQEMATHLTSVGVMQEEPNDPLGRFGSHLAQVAVYLRPEAERDRSAEAIIADLRARIGTPAGVTQIAFARVSTGPYVGRPVAIELRGDDLAAVSAAADAVGALLATLPGVHDIRDDDETGKQELRVRVDEAMAMRAGFSMAEVGRTVRAIYSGERVTTIRRTQDEVDVVVRYPAAFPYRADGLRHVHVGNVQGLLTPLTAVAREEEVAANAFIRHVDFKRTITVTAEVDAARTTPLAVDRAIAAQLPALQQRFPTVAVHAGGEIQESSESLASTYRAMAFAVLLILGILLAALPSTAGVVAALITLPFGALGVCLGFALQGKPLSFMALFGAIGLAGVIVDSALIVILLAEQLQREGMSPRDAVLQACTVRFRPIVLVTATTALALLPSAVGIGGSDGLIQPAALAMDWGLVIGTCFSLFAVPLVYVTIADGCFPTRRRRISD